VWLTSFVHYTMWIIFVYFCNQMHIHKMLTYSLFQIHIHKMLTYSLFQIHIHKMLTYSLFCCKDFTRGWQTTIQFLSLFLFTQVMDQIISTYFYLLFKVMSVSVLLLNHPLWVLYISNIAIRIYTKCRKQYREKYSTQNSIHLMFYANIL
jgi:hypothetical protein